MLGGPIVDAEKINLTASVEGNWIANLSEDFETVYIATGHTPLVAAMRCYVRAKLSESVEVPDELISTSNL